ncbi:MAG: DUF3786 domain-containing protein [Thermodesulfovibrionales bacterium]|nr:DUF3786 domain-containing protein [Thermodesulfovibrionales bacterium]
MKKQSLNNIKTFSGEQKAWDILDQLNPVDVCKNSLAFFNQKKSEYIVKSFGIDFVVSTKDRTVKSEHPIGTRLIEIKEFFFELSIVWYLASAKNVFPSGKWVKPIHIKGGQIFALGTHKLPLEELAELYRKDLQAFISKASQYSARPCNFADACVVFYPFPKIPLQLLLWTEDEEFPARAELMLDSTCDIHLPTDVIWAITNFTVLLMF